MPPFRDVTVGRLLTQLAQSIPDREALVYSDRDLRWTFRELEAEARLIARGLIGAGVQRGDRVAVWATNVPEWIVLQFALAKIGAILVTVNTSLRAREIEYLLRQSETSTLVTIAGFKGVDYMAEMREAAPATVRSRVLHRRFDVRRMRRRTRSCERSRQAVPRRRSIEREAPLAWTT